MNMRVLKSVGVRKTPANTESPAKLCLVPSANVITPPKEYPNRMILDNGILKAFVASIIKSSMTLLRILHLYYA